MSSHDIAPVRTYLLAWLALLALLLLTVGSAYVRLGGFNTAVNIGIAVAKALVVMAFFMHLRSGSTVTRLVAAAGFFWLVLLLSLASTDFGMR